MSKRSVVLFGLMIAGLFALAACADPAQPTATPNTSINPTAAPSGNPTATPSGQATVAPTEAPSGPDASAGQSVFTTNCAACHNTSDQQLVGPGLAGIGERAGTRVSGQSADDYLRASIQAPGEFIVEGFQPIMPAFPQISDGDLDNLIAYLMTLE